MNINHKKYLISFLCFFAIFIFITAFPANALTIKEKKDGLLAHGGSDLDPQTQELLKTINQELTQKQEELSTLYSQVMDLYKQNASECEYQELLNRINSLKVSISELDGQWRERVARSGLEEGYGLWYQPDTNIEQLVIDYGSQDFVYLIPPDIATMKLSVDSNLPIPRSSWSEMLETILAQNGIGIKQINPYLRELYLLATNQSAVKVITNKRCDLGLFPGDMRVCFVLSPEPSDVKRIWFFLDKFVNHNSTVVQHIGRDIMIIGSVNEIQDLLKLYDFAALNRGEKEYKLVSLSRINAEEMAKILGAIFDQIADQHNNIHPPTNDVLAAERNGLQVIILGNVSQALFLVGTKEEVCKAEEIIREVDFQLGDVREKMIYWYTAKNSDAEELAEVLSKIYNLMVQENICVPDCADPGQKIAGPGPLSNPLIDSPAVGAPVAEIIPLKTPDRLYQESFFLDGSVAVNPAPVTLVSPPVPYTTDHRHNFIVDVKTNSIVMVVEADILPKMKELLKKLDVPKKMVQIEVLLFEKRLSDSLQFGLNLLRVGSAASQTHKTALVFNDILPLTGFPNPFNKGLLSFILSRPKENGPAFDLVYNFLLSQQDVQINACPSVITMNQTPAKFAIVEEFSINTGVFEVETAKGVTLKDAFTRAQYGITLEITPTIHMWDPNDIENCDDDDGVPDYITLETNVNFDTVHPEHHSPNRPSVTRRNIANEVLIPDGQTVVLGGLRRKHTHDCKDSIPFLGELPGIGKLFSNTSMHDSSTEMFIFITPKIISDPIQDIERLKREEMIRRPGDIPEYICCLEQARRWERIRLMEGSMKMLLGRQPENCYSPYGEYDGR